MDNEDAGRLVDLLQSAFSEVARNTQGTQPDGATIIAGGLTRIAGKLNELHIVFHGIHDNFDSITRNLLETTALMVLQKENAGLVAEMTKLRLRNSQLMAVIQDLSSPCIGCKKAPWSPHTPECAWSSAVGEAVKKALEPDEQQDD
jgi:hypothetical protein